MERKIILIAILSLFLILNYVGAQEILEDVFYFHLIVYKNDTVTLNDFEVIEGIQSDFPTAYLNLNYSIMILSTQDNMLFRAQVPVSFTAYPSLLNDSGGPVELDKSEHYLRLPYFENSDRIDIYKDDELIFIYEICNVNDICEEDKGETLENCLDDCQKSSVCGNNKCETGETQKNCCKDCGCSKDMDCVDNKCISEVIEKCGNDVCDQGENYENCAEDCLSGLKDDYCDGEADELCDPDCSKEEDIDCAKPANRTLIYVIIGVVVGVLLFIILTKSRREA